MAVTANAVWRIRPSGSNTNGGGFDASISGAGTDYSQQNAAQATGTNGSTSGAGVTTFVDATANAFTSAMVGNVIWIASGTNFQVSGYFVTAFTSASTVTLDRTPSSGGAGSAGVWKLGGGWADFTNCNTTVNLIVPGNTVYVLGSGTPNPSSYTYDYTFSATVTLVSGNTTAGYIRFLNDPNTPGYKAYPDTTGGMPVLRGNLGGAGQMFNTQLQFFAGFWFVEQAQTRFIYPGGGGGSGPTNVVGCVFDFFGITGSVALYSDNNRSGSFHGCEVFDSVGSASGCQGVNFSGGSFVAVTANNLHDIGGQGVSSGNNNPTVIKDNIVAKNSSDGLIVDGGASGQVFSAIINNTIDGNGGNGIVVSTQAGLAVMYILNNIISNHTTGGKFGLTISAGSAAANSLVQAFVDYNVYYNNSANYNAINAGVHDTALGASPYVNSTTENYALA